MTGPEATEPPSTEERWRRQDEREFLRRSLGDARAEHDAGDLSDADFELLVRRDSIRLAALEAELTMDPEPDATEQAPGAGAAAPSAGGPSRPDAPGRPVPASRQPDVLERIDRRRRRSYLIGGVGVLAILVGALVLVVYGAGPRLPGEGASGGVTLNRDQQVARQLGQAATLVQQNRLVEALAVYRQVLSEEPNQPEALAVRGWLEWEGGSEDHAPGVAASGEASVRKAVVVSPGFYAGHLYLGTIELVGHHDPGAAVAQYRLFLADHPPAAWVRTGAPFIREAFSEAGQPLPASVPPA